MSTRFKMGLVVLAAMMAVPAIGFGGMKYCKKRLKALDNPFVRAVNLDKEHRDVLTAQFLRYFEPTRRFNEILRADSSTADLDGILDNVVKTDLRVPGFEWAAGLLTTMNAPSLKKFGPILKPAYKTADAFRFATGNFTDALDITKWLSDIRANAKKKGVKPGITRRFQEEADKEVAEGKETYKQFLKENGWVGKNPEAMKKLQRAATILSTLPEEEDLMIIRSDMTKYMRDQVLNIHFDMTDLEGGIHRWRRHLRWIAIMFQVLNTFVVYEPSMGAENFPGAYVPEAKNTYVYTLDPSVLKYTILKDMGKLEHPVLVSKSAYEYLTYLVAKIGAYKEVGQRIERFKNIYLKAEKGLTEDQAYDKALKLAQMHPLYMDYHVEAEKLYEEFRASGLMEQFIDEVLNGIDARLAQIKHE